jgi:hypothetical protein
MTHSLDEGRDRLRKLIDGFAETEPRLPLVHSTDSYILADMLDKGEISPQSCSVFNGEALTYLFYGRPAFRPNNSAEPTSLGHYFPVCLLMKPTWQGNVKRVFPFDSGAFQQELYGAYLHKKMKLGDFRLEADMSTPGKLITLFFGNVPAYLRARPESSVNFDAAEFEAQSYRALINAKDGNAIDSRGSGIEVQTSEPISISDSLAAVILPSTFVDGSMGNALQKLKIDVLPYNTFERSRPSEYMSELTSICFSYYAQLGLIAKGVI